MTRMTQRAMTLVATTAILGACAQTGPAGAPGGGASGSALVIGSDLCLGQAEQIYFPDREVELGEAALQVLAVMSETLKACPRRGIKLVSVPGSDTAAPIPEIVSARAARVRDALISRGVPASRIEVVTSGPLVSGARPVPIGRVLVTTR